MDTIALGKHNPRIADIQKAIRRNTLTSDGLLPIEGPNLLEEALRSGLDIDAVLLREGTDAPPYAARCRKFVLEPSAFKAIQATEHSQGIVALVRLRAHKLGEILKAAGTGPIVVLAGLQDPGNVGTILRVAEAFGAAGILALSGTCSVLNPKVIRAAAGSLFRLPHLWNVRWDDALAGFRAAAIETVGTSPHADLAITTWNWKQPVAILIGNEGNGLTEEMTTSCSALLRIPQQPAVESLNSAIATAVVLYESWRGRHPQ